MIRSLRYSSDHITRRVAPNSQCHPFKQFLNSWQIPHGRQGLTQVFEDSN